MPVDMFDIICCPFCESREVNAYNYARSEVKCDDCGAVFRILEGDDSEREVEE